jgi:hypothetical protein
MLQMPIEDMLAHRAAEALAASPPDDVHHNPREPQILAAAPRCGARARTRGGAPCRSPAVRGSARCRMHGGKGSGAPCGNRNAWKHGAYSGRMKAIARYLRFTAMVVKHANRVIWWATMEDAMERRAAALARRDIAAAGQPSPARERSALLGSCWGHGRSDSPHMSPGQATPEISAFVGMTTRDAEPIQARRTPPPILSKAEQSRSPCRRAHPPIEFSKQPHAPGKPRERPSPGRARPPWSATDPPGVKSLRPMINGSIHSFHRARGVRLLRRASPRLSLTG